MSPMESFHMSVLPAEVLAGLQPQPGGVFIDGTLGGGGHALALLHASQPGGRLLGIDADPDALQSVQQRFSVFACAGVAASAYTLLHGNFASIGTLARAYGFADVDGVLFDLGVSSYQLDTPERGFSFLADAPLDMRLDPTQGSSAADLVAELDATALADLIFRYGEERFSRRIARRIVERRRERPIETTGDLADLVMRSMPARGGRSRIHPATRTFQALRIAVNDELAHLEEALPQAVDLLRPGGRLAVISFHSLEDRIVKQFMRAESGYGGSEAADQPVRLRILTKKPIVPGAAELAANPRSRSARLRIAEKIVVADIYDDY